METPRRCVVQGITASGRVLEPPFLVGDVDDVAAHRRLVCSSWAPTECVPNPCGDRGGAGHGAQRPLSRRRVANTPRPSHHALTKKAQTRWHSGQSTSRSSRRVWSRSSRVNPCRAQPSSGGRESSGAAGPAWALTEETKSNDTSIRAGSGRIAAVSVFQDTPCLSHTHHCLIVVIVKTPTLQTTFNTREHDEQRAYPGVVRVERHQHTSTSH